MPEVTLTNIAHLKLKVPRGMLEAEAVHALGAPLYLAHSRNKCKRHFLAKGPLTLDLAADARRIEEGAPLQPTRHCLVCQREQLALRPHTLAA